jgi:hypothetical protein
MYNSIYIIYIKKITKKKKKKKSRLFLRLKENLQKENTGYFDFKDFYPM